MSVAKGSRILLILKIFNELTDEDHPLTLNEIRELLLEEGIDVERKSLYRDFKALDEAGYPIGRSRTRPCGYYLESRTFTRTQLMLLIDAVQSSRSITKKNSEDLIRRLKTLVSKHENADMEDRIHVAGRVKMQDESVFSTLDAVQSAMAQKRDISFGYRRYDICKNLVDVDAQDGNPRVRTPLGLVYDNENYYMLAYDEGSENNVRIYRVDRMTRVTIGCESDKAHRLASGFDIVEFERRSLGMYGGKPVSIKLEASEEHIGSLIDIFGFDHTTCIPMKKTPASLTSSQDGDDSSSSTRWASVRISAVPSPVLFGKIAQFGGNVRIVSPTKVVEQYEAHLEDALKAQRSKASNRHS